MFWLNLIKDFECLRYARDCVFFLVDGLFLQLGSLSSSRLATAMYAESVFQYLKLTYWYDTNVIPWKYFEFVIGGENLEKQYPTFA